MINPNNKFVPKFLINKINLYFEKLNWEKNEKRLTEKRRLDKSSVPVPHVVKQEIIKYYATKYDLKIFVETGTFLGKMIISVKNIFEQIISVELAELLHKRAIDLFKSHKHIQIKNGNSADVLPIILKTIDRPCLFWLDGHYSGGITAKADIETPIIAEISSILNHKVKGHVILIDDARLFIGTRDYPTINKIKQLISGFSPNLKLEIKDDIIAIYQ